MIQRRETPEMAVGINAITSSFRHVFGAMPLNRGLKTLLSLNQKDKIDCPSCAWPDPDGHRHAIAEYCENGAKAIAEEATTRQLGVPLFQKYTVSQLREKSDFWLGKQGRLTHPMYLPENEQHYQPISWPEAFDVIAREIKQLKSPDEAVFYTSGRSSNESAYLYQLFARQLGTNNLPDCSNMCHESSGVSLQKTLGIGKGTVKLEDFYKSELIIIMGQNPGTNHPRMLTALEKAKQNGAKIVAVNPLKETGLMGFKNPQTVHGMLGGGTELSDLYLQLKINSDMALLQLVGKYLLEMSAENSEILDHEFIDEFTHDFESYRNSIQGIDEDKWLADTGLSKGQVLELASLIAQKKRIIICWAMGLTQHKNSVGTLNEVVNILLLRGAVGIEGAGTCPVRGHSNVQGDRTVGITHKPAKAFNTALQKKYGFSPPEKTGLDVVESIEAMHAGQAKVFVALGGNFYSAAPDSDFTAEAFAKTNLTVHISTKLNRSHLMHGKKALILPCLGRTDIDRQKSGVQYQSTENSMGVVQKTQGVLEPLSENMMSEPAIIARMAEAVLGNEKINWKGYINDYSRIRQEIADTITGFDKYETKLAQDGGFYLPNGPRKRIFPTEAGKANFTANCWEPVALKKDEFLMMTIRSHDQFNTTIYGLNDRYRGIFNERRIVFMNETDIEKLQLQPYEKVDLTNHFGDRVRIGKAFIVVPYAIPEGNLATYFPEANVLVPLRSFADGSQTPTSKSVVVKVSKSQAE